jgi:lipoyl(octanoyl) transferase
MAAPGPSVTWMVSPTPVAYDAACAAMSRRVEGIAAGTASELVWLLEHPPLYTAGTSAKNDDLLIASHLPVHRTGRGGQFTYHGPGQRVAYVMIDVRKRFGDVRAYVAALEEWMIETLGALGIEANRQQGRVGAWVHRPERVAAIGVRLSRWVSSHGVSLNIAPNLDHYRGIVPCGIQDAGVTSLADLGVRADMNLVDAALRTAFERRIAQTFDAGDGGLPEVAAAPGWSRTESKSAPPSGGPDRDAPELERPR